LLLVAGLLLPLLIKTMSASHATKQDIRDMGIAFRTGLPSEKTRTLAATGR